ncbi:hypothetical protein [Peribacillus simplex]
MQIISPEAPDALEGQSVIPVVSDCSSSHSMRPLRSTMALA